MIEPVLARLLMAIPGVARAVRWLADRPELTLDERIGLAADRLVREHGFDAIAALAGAEAVELGRLHGLRYDRVTYDADALLWLGFYEAGPHKAPTLVVLPLERATESTQRGVASMN